MNIDANNYFDALLKQKPPTPKENMVLINKAIRGNKNDKWNLVLRNIRYVRSIAGRHLKGDYSQLNDMMVDGLDGFFHAVTKVHKCCLSQFMAYTASWIENYIVENLRKRKSIFNSSSERVMGITDSLDAQISFPIFSPEMLTLNDIMPDRTQMSPSELGEYNDARNYAVNFIKEICDGKYNKHFSKKEIETLKLWVRCNGEGMQMSKVQGVSKQCIYFNIDKVVKKIALTFENYGLEKDYGTKGRVINYKLGGNKDKVCIRYTVDEIDNRHFAHINKKISVPSSRLFVNNKGKKTKLKTK